MGITLLVVVNMQQKQRPSRLLFGKQNIKNIFRSQFTVVGLIPVFEYIYFQILKNASTTSTDKVSPGGILLLTVYGGQNKTCNLNHPVYSVNLNES